MNGKGEREAMDVSIIRPLRSRTANRSRAHIVLRRLVFRSSFCYLGGRTRC